MQPMQTPAPDGSAVGVDHPDRPLCANAFDLVMQRVARPASLSEPDDLPRISRCPPGQRCRTNAELTGQLGRRGYALAAQNGV